MKTKILKLFLIVQLCAIFSTMFFSALWVVIPRSNKLSILEIIIRVLGSPFSELTPLFIVLVQLPYLIFFIPLMIIIKKKNVQQALIPILVGFSVIHSFMLTYFHFTVTFYSSKRRGLESMEHFFSDGYPFYLSIILFNISASILISMILKADKVKLEE